MIKTIVVSKHWSLCYDCIYQNGTWINARELDTWCTILKNIDCDKVFECKHFKEDLEG